MDNKIIGFNALSGSGKDAAADAIVSKFGNDVVLRFSFARALKECVKVTHNLNDYQVYGGGRDIVDEFWGKTPREILIEVGTKYREIDEDHWIKLVERQVSKIGKHYRIILFTDVRYENEATFIRNLGGIIVRIERPSVVRKTDHVTESGLCHYDVVIDNEGTLEEYNQKVLSLL